MAAESQMVFNASGDQVRRGDVGRGEIRHDEIEFGELIGKGCFGSVWKGRCRSVPVAIKKLNKQDLDEKALEEFRKEVDIMSHMRAPNVVLFMGACTEAGRMCIVTELLHGNVESALKKHRDLPVPIRLKMAKGCAAGMSWLHGARPQIIHRDLKPANLLIDEHWNVKVCDFGLSQVKLPNQIIKDGKSIPGTPLWMAPEVMLGKDVDEKSDVYSFGIVLWEIITGQELWPEMTSYPQFKEAVAKSGQRPPIPTSVHHSLKNLMEICWQKEPKQRPSFQEIVRIIDSVLIDCLISDDVANKFWKDNFLGDSYVAWDVFIRKFSELLKIDITGTQKKESIISTIMKTATGKSEVGVLCLKKLIAEPNPMPQSTDPFAVNVEQFAKIINWFGPLDINHKNYSIVDKIETVMEKEWFFGDISKEEAENLLTGQPKGTFLVRGSSTQPDKPFTISKMSKKSKINHQRITKEKNGSLTVNIVYSDGKSKSEVQADGALEKLIKKLTKELFLEHACAGSPFRSLFVKSSVEGYLPDQADDDEED